MDFQGILNFHALVYTLCVVHVYHVYVCTCTPKFELSLYKYTRMCRNNVMCVYIIVVAGSVCCCCRVCMHFS